MSPGDQPASDSTSQPSEWRDRAGCLAYLLAWFALTGGPLFIRPWSWFYQVVFDLVALSLVALVVIHRIHRRGQTIAEAIAASRAERRRQAGARTRAREAAAALPWMHDKRLGPGAVPGVLITPAPDVPGYYRTSYDVVLDSAGHKMIQVIKEVRALTGLGLKEAKDLVDDAPATVLRVPDVAMAHAARTILESAGATVSITDQGHGKVVT
jgi:hypothetical protein